MTRPWLIHVHVSAIVASPRVNEQYAHRRRACDSIQLLTSISVDIRIYLPLKVIFTSAEVNITFKGR